MVFINQTKMTILADKGRAAETFWQRGKGLLGESGLGEGEALAIMPCDSIHMFFMKFAIDVIFFDHAFKVVKAVEDVRPWGMAWGGRQAFGVLELPVGTIRRTQTEVGDDVELRD